MEGKTNINTMELMLNDEYLIKPLMTIGEIKQSNLIEIMDEKSKINLEEDLPYPLFIKQVIDGEALSVRLDIVKERLMGIYIYLDQEGSLQSYSEGDGDLGIIQIPQIEGINEVEHNKLQELCKIYGKFPSEDNLTGSIKSLQNKIKKISDEINAIISEKATLEEVDNAFKALDEIYNKYEVSGFDENILNENVDNIAKYEKTKELLKSTDINDEVELRNRIESYENKIGMLEQTQNNLNRESNQISDSYSAYQKYKDIGIRKLDQLKKEFLCNLKAKDELKTIFTYESDKITQQFCKEKIKTIDVNIENLDKEIKSIGIINEVVNDDNIEYFKQKVRDEERYLQQNHLLNDINKENDIKKIARNSMEDISSNMYNDLNVISELYNIETRISEIQKEIELKEDLIELQREAKILEDVKEKLEITDKYKPIITTRDKHKDNELFKNSYEKKYEKEIQEFNQAQSDLAELKINNWDEYNEAKDTYDKKEQEVLKTKSISEVEDLDNTKEFDKIAKYKSKRDDIIKKNSNLLDNDMEESSRLDDKTQETELDKDSLNESEKSIENEKEVDKESTVTKVEETNVAVKVTDNKNKAKQRKGIRDSKNNVTKTEQVQNNSHVETNSNKANTEQVKVKKPKTLGQLKNELICSLKAKDELNTVSIYSNDKEIKDFCENKIKELDLSIKNLDNEISPLGVLGKSEIDDKIKYLKEKLADKKRYLREYVLLNDINMENQIKDIVKKIIVELDAEIGNEFKEINQLYTIQNEITEVQKGIDLKQQIIELEEEGKRLEDAKENLNTVSKYKHMMAFMTTFSNDMFYDNVYQKSLDPQAQKYNQAQKELEEMKISNKKDYKESKKNYDSKKKRILSDKNVAQITNLDSAQELEKIENYKNKQNEIINKQKAE